MPPHPTLPPLRCPRPPRNGASARSSTMNSRRAYNGKKGNFLVSCEVTACVEGHVHGKMLTILRARSGMDEPHDDDSSSGEVTIDLLIFVKCSTAATWKSPWLPPIRASWHRGHCLEVFLLLYFVERVQNSWQWLCLDPDGKHTPNGPLRTCS
jgi:hypothetical protein